MHQKWFPVWFSKKLEWIILRVSGKFKSHNEFLRADLDRSKNCCQIVRIGRHIWLYNSLSFYGILNSFIFLKSNHQVPRYENHRQILELFFSSYFKTIETNRDFDVGDWKSEAFFIRVSNGRDVPWLSRCPCVPGQVQDQKSWDKLLYPGTSRDKIHTLPDCQKIVKNNFLTYFLFFLLSRVLSGTGRDRMSKSCPGLSRLVPWQDVKITARPVARFWACPFVPGQ